MDIQVISLLITVATMLISIGAVYGSLKTQLTVLNKNMDDLSERVTKHNNLVERMAVGEQGLKTAFHRIDELREDMKEINHNEH